MEFFIKFEYLLFRTRVWLRVFRVEWSRSEIASLLVLVVLVACTLLVRLRGELYTHVVLLGVSTVVLNVVLLFPGRIECRGLLGVYSGYALFTSITGIVSALNFLSRANYAVDLAHVVLLLVVLTIYYYNSRLREVFVAYIPVVVLVSVITGVYLELESPLKYAVLALLDVSSIVIILSTVKNSIAGLAASLLVFPLLYTTSLATVDYTALSVLFALYTLRTLLALRGKMRELRLITSLDLLVRPVVVAYL